MHLHDDEAAEHALRRLAARRIDEARVATRGDHAVHDVRKLLKETRALVRLFRGALGEKAYAREDARLRRVARLLGGLRDAEVLLETLDGLEPEGFGGLRRALRERAGRARLDAPARLERAARALAREARSARRLELDAKGWDALAPGLERTYRRARQRMRAAHEDPSDLALHAWRKQVKHLRTQLRLLEHAWPQSLGRTAEALHTLGDLLGTDHDLAVLATEAAGPPARSLDRAETVRLAERIATRRAELQDEAFALGARTFARKPGKLLRTLHAHWKSWRR